MQDIKIQTINQYKHKNAYIVNSNLFLSYNTLIAASIDGVTYITSRTYSNTTSHHKTDALRYFNNQEVITVKPDTLYKLAAGYDPELLEVIQEEHQQRQDLLTALYNKDNTAKIITHLKYIRVIKARKEPETTPYKNGNSQTKYFYTANFQHQEPVYYEVNQKATPHYITKGNKGKFKTYKYQYNIVNIKEV